MLYDLDDQTSASTSTLKQLKKPTSSGRYAILPSYPTVANHTDTNLLLTNIPSHHLEKEDLERRCQQGYHQPTALKPTNDHERQIFSLSRLWNINRDILKHNFGQLMNLNRLFAANRIHCFSTRPDQEYIGEEEYALALEFFLQIDVHLFYMKTCSYRGAQTLLLGDKNLFCLSEPQARYGITRCNELSCCLCYPSYKGVYRLQQPIIRFGSHQRHTFINGYESILNCPASCTTKNIIYVLTCPCRQVDYIGETSSSLNHRLVCHQEHGNRILQEFLFGEKNTARIRNELPSFEKLVKNDMKLYQHSTRCSHALQWFLDENPEYWRFIPRKMSESDEQREEKELVHYFEEPDRLTYANDVPIPPNGYRFSYEQKNAIDRFFSDKLYLNTPNLHMDLYQTTIIAILPVDATAAIRRFVEALFITQAETKLNTMGHLDQFVSTHTVNPMLTTAYDDWCRNLVRR
ncbi:unnamed protein product [Rotaria sp. Silwood1]|nr:unnamed protein product [Rotaria sp. Silwood1]CAF4818758.1 unnamed protein product [Rotaria sp. Silwood1]CAF4886697.1 unnamed protein product [Rotaria sp. Silwood1]